MQQTLEICGRTLRIRRTSKARPDAVVYLHAEAAGAEDVFARLQTGEAPARSYALVSISGVDWNRDLSPWPAKRAFRRGEDFFGGADAYLSLLTGRLLPAAEEALGGTPDTRVLAGYSMAGLFALYAAYRADCFDRIACLSGSLWYDGFIAFMEAHTPSERLKAACFSLGTAEKNASDPRLSPVERCTFAAERILMEQGVSVQHTAHPGGHFSNVSERIADGVRQALRAGEGEA